MVVEFGAGVYNRQRFWCRRTELAQQMAKLARRLSDRQTGLLRPNRLSLGISPVYLPVNTLSMAAVDRRNRALKEGDLG